ncbi:hypothetical protein LOD99_5838 [Oopsacas minuta]|uniref:Uncharacterized protein n=1 Tax=Oopsacas minuta TaxID=111878 RepID=A0AAV7JNY5_9METZ|nr:hypothetical protein LOD99_5838 [Oopsacas minuta]
MGENRSNIAACLCAPCSAIATLASIISGVIYLVTNNQSYSATEWHNSTISNTENFQSIPFNAFDCPRDKYFYSLAFPVYVHIRSPENTGITLALQNGNTSDSHIIASCYANVNEVCSIALDGAENVFAFVTMDSVSEDNPVVGWSFPLVYFITNRSKEFYPEFEQERSTILISIFDSPECVPIDSELYHPKEKSCSKTSLNYVEVGAPDHGAWTFALKEENVTTSLTIGSCFLIANEICRIPIEKHKNIFAFVTFETFDTSEKSASEWVFYYVIPSVLLTFMTQSCCGCLVFFCVLLSLCFGIVQAFVKFDQMSNKDRSMILREFQT